MEVVIEIHLPESMEREVRLPGGDYLFMSIKLSPGDLSRSSSASYNDGEILVTMHCLWDLQFMKTGKVKVTPTWGLKIWKEQLQSDLKKIKMLDLAWATVPGLEKEYLNCLQATQHPEDET